LVIESLNCETLWRACTELSLVSNIAVSMNRAVLRIKKDELFNVMGRSQELTFPSLLELF